MPKVVFPGFRKKAAARRLVRRAGATSTLNYYCFQTLFRLIPFPGDRLRTAIGKFIPMNAGGETYETSCCASSIHAADRGVVTSLIFCRSACRFANKKLSLRAISSGQRQKRLPRRKCASVSVTDWLLDTRLVFNILHCRPNHTQKTNRKPTSINRFRQTIRTGRPFRDMFPKTGEK